MKLLSVVVVLLLCLQQANSLKAFFKEVGPQLAQYEHSMNSKLTAKLRRLHKKVQAGKVKGKAVIRHVNAAIDSTVDEVVKPAQVSGSPYLRAMRVKRRARHRYDGTGNPYIRNYEKRPAVRTSDGPYVRHHAIHPTLTRQRTMWLMQKKKERERKKKHSVTMKALKDQGLHHDYKEDQAKKKKKEEEQANGGGNDRSKKSSHQVIRFRKTTGKGGKSDSHDTNDAGNDNNDDDDDDDEGGNDNPYLKEYAHPHHKFRKTPGGAGGSSNEVAEHDKHRVVRFVTNEKESGVDTSSSDGDDDSSGADGDPPLVEIHHLKDGTVLRTRKLTKFAHQGNRAYVYSHHHDQEDPGQEESNEESPAGNGNDNGDDMSNEEFHRRMRQHKVVANFDNDDIALPHVLPPADEIRRVVHEDNKKRTEKNEN